MALTKEDSIVKQSSLKCLKDICDILDYKPETLHQLLRLNDIIASYAQNGMTGDVTYDVKAFDKYIKNKKTIKVDID